MIKKKIFIGCMVFLSIIIFLMTIIIISLNNKLKKDNKKNSDIDKSVLDMGFGDSIDGLQVFDINGNKTILKISENNNILFYLSSSCHNCVNILNFSERLIEVFGEDYLNIIFIWYDNIPLSLLEKYNIKKENCYHLDNTTILSSSTPSAFLLDNKGNIKFCSSDIQLTIEKLYNDATINESNQEKFRINAIQYLKSQYDIAKPTKRQVVYFYMKGCPDCDAADKVLSMSKERKYFDLHYLYKYDDADPSHYKDDYALFRLIFGIKWYPSFVVFKEDLDYKIIGEVPLNTLIDEIIK